MLSHPINMNIGLKPELEIGGTTPRMLHLTGFNHSYQRQPPLAVARSLFFQSLSLITINKKAKHTDKQNPGGFMWICDCTNLFEM